MEYLKVFLTTILSIGVLFIITKLIGYREMSQMSLLDYVNGITIGSIAAELATSIEENWIMPLWAMIIYGAWVIGSSYLTLHSSLMRKFLVGKPIVMYEQGRLYYDSLRRSRMDVNDFLMECRNRGFFSLSDAEKIILEPNGKMSIIPIPAKRPLTPSDMKIPVSPESVPIDVIIDGNVSLPNLLATGKDMRWLMSELRKGGVATPSDVVLGLYSSGKNLEVYTKVYSDKEKKKSNKQAKRQRRIL